MSHPYFLEIDYYQLYKKNQRVCGDTFISKKEKNRERAISVLSDGLGSGVKANVLSTLTASMAYRYTRNFRDIQKSAEVIMKTLPVCKERRISYSTFTIADIDKNGFASIVEYDNPSYILARENRLVSIKPYEIKGNVKNVREYSLRYSKFKIQYGDRLILFSDGVTQAGMGTRRCPLGWGQENVANFAAGVLEGHPTISAGDLARKIAYHALELDDFKACDDITCGVIYYRRPRKLMLMTGPPIQKEKDKGMAALLSHFNGKKVICGGTTAKIISRELERKVTVNIKKFDPHIPPSSSMEGVDLITEGTITLAKAAEFLEKETFFENLKDNAVKELLDRLLESDSIHFVVGTKINEAHQDPNIPVELEIRRNLVKKIVGLLENKFLKEVKLQFI